MSDITEICVSDAEVRDGTLSDENRTRAVAALDQDGIVVLRNVVDPKHLETLHERMKEDLEKILVREDAPFNFNTSNVQQDPPPFDPYLFKDILVNEQVIAVTRAVLGPGVKNSFYSGNTALPGGTRQPVHPDVGQLWDNLIHSTPAYALVVNVPVVDVSPANGSTEIWPGTHKDTMYSIHQGSTRIPEDILARRAAVRPPLQPTLPAGSVIIRDMRLWHAGMPNHTDVPRPMIAMIHWCGWWNDEGKVPFAKGTEEFFEHPVLRTNARFVEKDEIDYIHHGAAYDVQK